MFAWGLHCLVFQSHLLVVLPVWLEKWLQMSTNGCFNASLGWSPGGQTSNGEIRNETWLLFKVRTCSLLSRCLFSSMAKMYSFVWRTSVRCVRERSGEWSLFSALYYWFVRNSKYMVHLSRSQEQISGLWNFFQGCDCGFWNERWKWILTSG